MSDRKRITLADAYEQYMAASRNMKPLGRDHWHRRWPLIKPVLGHLYLDEVTTLEMDKLKQSLPAHYAPSTVNHHLALVRAVLRYALKRNLLQSIPYVPTEKVIRKQPRWYTEAERDRLLRACLRCNRAGMPSSTSRHALDCAPERSTRSHGIVFGTYPPRWSSIVPSSVDTRTARPCWAAVRTTRCTRQRLAKTCSRSSAGTSIRGMRAHSSCSARMGPSPSTWIATSARCAPCRRRSGYPSSLTTRSVVTRWQAKPRQTVNRSEPSRLNSGTAQLRAPRCTRTLVAVLNCASFGRSNRRHRHIVVNIWSTRVKIENRETRNHS